MTKPYCCEPMLFASYLVKGYLSYSALPIATFKQPFAFGIITAVKYNK